MRVIHICTSDKGGAFNAAYNLHLGLLDRGIESKVLVLRKYQSLPFVTHFLAARNIFQRIKDSFNTRFFEAPKKRKKFNVIFSSPESPYDILRHPEIGHCDLINLHWVSGFIDFPSFFKNVKKPIVWTLHDMHPFSGGNHYNILRIPAMEELITQQIQLKIESIKASQVNISVVSPSKWLMEESFLSEPFHDLPHFHIPYGINTKDFHYRDQRDSRSKLGVLTEKKIILFIADDLNDVRKGVSLLLKALKSIDQSSVLLMIVGNGSLNLQKNNIESINFGFVSNPEKLALIYAAADVFVIPSIEDNFPNTILESLCCGTPVVGFNIGGCEGIKEGINGFKAELNSEDSLVTCINKCLNMTFNREKISQDSTARFNLQKQATGYYKVYERCTQRLTNSK